MRGAWEGATEPAAQPLTLCRPGITVPRILRGKAQGEQGSQGGLIWGSSGLEAASALFGRNHACVCDHECKPMGGLHGSVNLNVAFVFL